MARYARGRHPRRDGRRQPGTDPARQGASRTLRNITAADGQASGPPGGQGQPPPGQDGLRMAVKPGYKKTEVGVIPDYWDVRELDTLSPFVTSGSRGWADYYSDRGSAFIRITNLVRDSIYID